jgi:hypothetical protein
MGVVILLVLAAHVIAAFYRLTNSEPTWEPTYQGKQLNYWLQVLRSGDWDVRYQAMGGFEVLGPNAKSAIPEILSLMKRDSYLRNLHDKPSGLKWWALVYSLAAIGPDAFTPP